MNCLEIGRQRFPEPVGMVVDYLIKGAEIYTNGKVAYRGAAILTEIGGTSIEAEVTRNKTKVKWASGVKEYADDETLMEVCYPKAVSKMFGQDVYPLFLQPIAPAIAELFGIKLPYNSNMRMLALQDPETDLPLHTVANITPSHTGKGRLGTISLLSLVYAGKSTPLFPYPSGYVEAHDEITYAIIDKLTSLYENERLDGLYPAAAHPEELMQTLSSNLESLASMKQMVNVPQLQMNFNSFKG